MSDYILDLRKIVGHRPLLQVGASIIVEDSEGKFLLQKRKDNHCWGYAGGSAGLDERVEDAAKRELFEETGLTANSIELFGVFSGKEMHYIYPNGDEVSNIDIVYICKDYSGELKGQETEVGELAFFDINSLPENISPPARIVLEKLKREYQKTDFTTVTACGECCTRCQKKTDGICKGCIEADGYVPEWTSSGRCKVHECARNHNVQFCGICDEFPCGKVTSVIHWNPDIIEHLSLLAKKYHEQEC